MSESELVDNVMFWVQQLEDGSLTESEFLRQLRELLEEPVLDKDEDGEEFGPTIVFEPWDDELDDEDDPH